MLDTGDEHDQLDALRAIELMGAAGERAMFSVKARTGNGDSRVRAQAEKTLLAIRGPGR